MNMKKNNRVKSDVGSSAITLGNVEKVFKEIKTINELLNVIRDRKSIYYEVNGKKYDFHIVRVLQTPLGDLMKQVKDGFLYYDITT